MGGLGTPGPQRAHRGDGVLGAARHGRVDAPGGAPRAQRELRRPDDLAQLAGGRRRRLVVRLLRPRAGRRRGRRPGFAAGRGPATAPRRLRDGLRPTARRRRICPCGSRGSLVGGGWVVLRGGPTRRLLPAEVDPARLVRRRVRHDPAPVPPVAATRRRRARRRAAAGPPRPRTLHRPHGPPDARRGRRPRTHRGRVRGVVRRAGLRLSRVLGTGTPFVVLEAVAGRGGIPG